jgi:hypothetical protein
MKRGGVEWTTEETLRLLDNFTVGWSLENLADDHQRTPAAIVSKLVKEHCIVRVRDAYHRVDPSPWITTKQLRIQSR